MTPHPLLCPCHLFAPKLGRLPFYGSIGTDLPLGLRKPPHFSSILSLHQNNEVRKILPRPIVFVVSHREPEELVLHVSNDIPCVIEEVGEQRLQCCVTGHL